MSDFSLCGYESVNSLEYLPILDKIKHDLNLILSMNLVSNNVALQTMQFDTTPNDKSLIKYDTKATSTENLPLETITSDGSSQTLGSRSCLTETVFPEGHYYNNLSESDNSTLNEIVELGNRNLRERRTESLQEELNSEPVNFKKMIDERDQTIKEKDIIISNLHRKIESEQSRMEEIIKDKETMIKDIADQLKRCENDQSIKKEKIIEEKVKMNQQLKKEINELNGTIKKNSEEHQAIIESMDEKINLLQDQLDEISTEALSFKTTVAERDKSLEKMRSKVESLKSKVELSNDELERKIEVILALENEIKELNTLQEELDAKDNYITNLKGKVKELLVIELYYSRNPPSNHGRESCEDDAFQGLSDKLKAKKLELRQKEKDLEKMEAKMEALEEKYKKLEISYKSNVRQLQKINEEHVECETKMEDLEKQIKTLRKQLKEADRKSIDDDKEKYMKEIESMKIAINGKTKEKQNLANENLELKKQKDSAENKIKHFETEISYKKKEIEELTKKCDNFEKQFNEMDENLKKKQGAIEKMKNKIKDSTNQDTCNNCRVLQREKENQQSELDGYMMKIEQYTQNLEDKYQENEILKKDVTRLTEELHNIKRLNFNEKGKDRDRNEQRNVTLPMQSNNTGNKADQKPYPNWWIKHMGRQ